jgi:hypothetical protein
MFICGPYLGAIWVGFWPTEGSFIGDSGWLGVISAPALFTALRVVPGGGVRRSSVHYQVGVVYDEHSNN